jgi:hypothetical protein
MTSRVWLFSRKEKKDLLVGMYGFRFMKSRFIKGSACGVITLMIPVAVATLVALVILETLMGCQKSDPGNKGGNKCTAFLASPTPLLEGLLIDGKQVFISPEFFPFISSIKADQASRLPSQLPSQIPSPTECGEACGTPALFYRLNRVRHFSSVLLGSDQRSFPLVASLLKSPLWRIKEVNPWGLLFAPITSISEAQALSATSKVTSLTTFTPTSSPAFIQKRSRNWNENEIHVKQITTKSVQIDTKPLFHISGTTIEFLIGTTRIPLSKLKLKDIYNQLVVKNHTQNYHYNEYEQLFLTKPNWEALPNNKQHPVLPKKLYDVRFKIIHNRIYIGRQIIYNQHYQLNEENCLLCGRNNSALHLFKQCRYAVNLWDQVQNKWLILLSSYKDSENNDLAQNDNYKISENIMLFGIETPKKTSYRENLIFQFMDILVGTMQKTIHDCYKKYQYEREIYSQESIYNIWKNRLIIAAKIIILRMQSKTAPYNGQWLFKKPKNLPKLHLIDESTCFEFFTELLNWSLFNEPNNNNNFALTSELESEKSSDEPF